MLQRLTQIVRVFSIANIKTFIFRLINVGYLIITSKNKHGRFGMSINMIINIYNGKYSYKTVRIIQFLTNEITEKLI